MKTWMMIVFLGLLGGCAHAPMCQHDFESILVGSDIEAVRCRYGAPFCENMLEDGCTEYRYILRFDVNSAVTEQREYIFKVRDGKIVDKQLRQEQSCNPYPYYQ